VKKAVWGDAEVSTCGGGPGDQGEMQLGGVAAVTYVLHGRSKESLSFECHSKLKRFEAEVRTEEDDTKMRCGNEARSYSCGGKRMVERYLEYRLPRVPVKLKHVAHAFGRSDHLASGDQAITSRSTGLSKESLWFV
jgi:hypothetical protein